MKDWLRQGSGFSDDKAEKVTKNENSKSPIVDKKPAAKLTYKLKRELEQLPLQIEACEQKIKNLEQQISMPGFYERDHEQTNKILEELDSQQQQLERYFDRWTEIENEQTS